MNKKFIIKNCYKDICEIDLNMDNVKYVFKTNISSDEILIVVDNGNKVTSYDSDLHGRIQDFMEDFVMLYPENIDLIDNYVSPNEKDNFICTKKGE